jgi:predicted transcriptional regulator
MGIHILDGPTMKTVQMTLDEELVQAVDQVSKQLNTNRSAFTRQALRDALAKFNREQLEKKHREGYERNPVAADEFSIWESEQVWGDEGKGSTFIAPHPFKRSAAPGNSSLVYRDARRLTSLPP